MLLSYLCSLLNFMLFQPTTAKLKNVSLFWNEWTRKILSPSTKSINFLGFWLAMLYFSPASSISDPVNAHQGINNNGRWSITKIYPANRYRQREQLWWSLKLKQLLAVEQGRLESGNAWIQTLTIRPMIRSDQKSGRVLRVAVGQRLPPDRDTPCQWSSLFLAYSTFQMPEKLE